jgi:transcriptional regulator with XRE-family HTH domain
MIQPSEELDRVMAELKAWCKREYGRQKDLASRLDTSEELLSNWLARRKTPSIEDYLKLKAFLAKQRKEN